MHLTEFFIVYWSVQHYNIPLKRHLSQSTPSSAHKAKALPLVDSLQLVEDYNHDFIWQEIHNTIWSLLQSSCWVD